MKTEIATIQRADAATIQFIAFEVGPDRYVLPIQAVVEFRTWSDPTPIPNAVQYIRGVTNVRGEIVPIFDVSARLGKGHTDATPRHVVILVRGSDRKTFGLLVDSVSDIIFVPSSDVASLPPLDDSSGKSYLAGIAPSSEGLLGIIDLEMFSAEAAVADVGA